MDNLEKLKFLKLYYSGYKKVNLNLELTNEEIKDFYKLAKFHSLEMVYYEALKINNIMIPSSFEKFHQQLLFKMATQDAELDIIKEAFTKSEIYHIPLKGSILRPLYDDPSLRTMADLDILIPIEDLPKAGNILKGLGYEVEHLGGNHDVYHKLPFMNIELHRALISDDYNTHEIYKDIWDKIDKKNYYCELDVNDLFIFLILHAGKHFTNGGAGLRFLMDLDVCLKKLSNLNLEYCLEELKKIEYDTFTKMFITFSEKIFNNNFDFTDDEFFILSYIIESGTYGTFEHTAAIGIEKEEKNVKKGKVSFFFSRVFPPYKTMKKIFPRLEKCPTLLPYYYIKRIFKVIFKSKTYKSQLKSINNVEEQDINDIKRVKEIMKMRSLD